MASRHNRVVRQLQLALSRGDWPVDAEISVILPELKRRVQRLQSLGREFESVRVSQDVIRLSLSEPALSAGCA
jgi:hypothetical protein